MRWSDGRHVVSLDQSLSGAVKHLRRGTTNLRRCGYLIQSQVSEILDSLTNHGANSKKRGARGRFQRRGSGELPEKK
jgi:hypothetical protein